MKITWYGTASILIEAAGERILFDPFVQLRGGENPNSIEDFIGEKYVCITHGHLDHLMEVPAFLDEEMEGDATIYCGSVAARTLEEQGLDTSSVVLVRPGMRWKIGQVELAVHEGKHAVPGRRLTCRTLCSPRMVRYLLNALFLLVTNRHFPEGGQTLLYELNAEGKRVLIMGSLGLCEGAEYPQGADLLILPFQGSAHLEEDALAVVERLQPARILLDHFDDAFPPVSHRMDTRKFKQRMDEVFPHIPVVRPTAGKPVVI